MIIDYNGDFSSDNDFVKKTNARIVEPYELPLNIFSISDEIINEGGKKLNKEKINKLTFLQDVLGTIIPKVGDVQKSNLRTAVLDAYRQAEINENFPVLNDIYENYLEVVDGKADAIVSALQRFIDYEIFCNDYNKCIPFNKFIDGIVILSVDEIESVSTKNTLVSLLLELVYGYMLKQEEDVYFESSGVRPKDKTPTSIYRLVDFLLVIDEARISWDINLIN